MAAILTLMEVGGGALWAGSPSHNALRINYIINCRLSRDLLVVSRVQWGVDYFLIVCR